MSEPKTLFELTGGTPPPADFANASLVLIDFQNDYFAGPLTLPDGAAALACAEGMLAAARAAGAPIFHIAHSIEGGALFDRSAHGGQIVDALAPRVGETVIEKPLPNSFAGTQLGAALKATGRDQIIVAGLMTHMCVSATTRAALDHGFLTTIEANACATRDLPDGEGGVVSAQALHSAELAALSDRFAIVVRNHDWTI
ncbi:cysteine hydrolase family protein [Magnetofaba australis]|uniref:Putative isochorismatase n=1 Tax=Magnetofaba australis IT-1 TaxID=1434232 RepID=A0A1Y2K089_9PROT|nr:cysteine hydrolase family protein [Magnetofaba australis]OSM01440.1 putative isochorismatase [Magnetofaba australis IT-1]